MAVSKDAKLSLVIVVDDACVDWFHPAYSL